MADKKISALTSLSPVDDDDLIVVVDVSDTTMASSGTTKKALKTEMKGDKGDTGTAATVDAGTTTTLAAGESATVTNVGTTSAAIFDFGIPKGEDGDNAYVYIAYASDDSGTDFTTTFDANLDYIAVKKTTAEILNPQASDFIGLWKNYKGATGANGVGSVIKLTTATAISTVAKTATLDGYVPAIGDIVALTFTNGNSAANITLNINGTGAVNILCGGLAPTALTGAVTAGGTIILYYTGSSFEMAGATRDTNTTYSEITEAEIDIGTASTARAISGRRAAYIIGKSVPLNGALGTPTSGTLTNCSGLPISGLTASTSTALGVGSINLGHASDTTLSRVSAGVVAIEGVNIVTTSSSDTLTNKTLGTTQLGEVSLKLDDTLSADEKWSGITTSGTAGATLAVGDLCYLNNDDGRWELVDANLSDGYDKQLGMCVLASTDGNATEMLVFGKIRSAAFPAFTVGSPLYISETAGDITHTQPTTADVCIRLVGFALTAEDMLFNPSNDYIVHT